MSLNYILFFFFLFAFFSHFIILMGIHVHHILEIRRTAKRYYLSKWTKCIYLRLDFKWLTRNHFHIIISLIRWTVNKIKRRKSSGIQIWNMRSRRFNHLRFNKFAHTSEAFAQKEWIGFIHNYKDIKYSFAPIPSPCSNMSFNAFKIQISFKF